MYPVIPLPGGLYIPSYFLVITLGYLVGLWFLYIRTQKYHMSMRTAMDSAMILMFGGFVGSRLFHIFFELPQYYLDHPADVFKVWQGGFVFYGGVIGGVLPVIFLMKHRREPMYVWMQVFAPVAPLVYAIGRFATLLSGSGYGKPTDLPWAITYPTGVEAPAGVALHPTPIYAIIWELMILVVVLVLQNKKTLLGRRTFSGFAFGFMIAFHGLGRAIIEQYRDDFRGELIAGLSVSTWISFSIIGLGVWISRSRIEPYAKED